MLNKAIGNGDVPVSSEIDNLDEKSGGDVEALVEAVEPALKKAHYGIGNTVTQIVIIEGNNNIVASFDQKSKDYLQNDVKRPLDVRDVSVAALNVNDLTGRVFIHDLDRTVPFKIGKHSQRRTLSNLSRGLDGYAHRTGATVQIQFQPIEAVDGRLKRVVIYDAELLSQLR